MKLTSCEKTLIRTSNKRPITLNQSKHVKKVRGQKKIQMGVAVFGGFVQWKQRKFRFLRMINKKERGPRSRNMEI